MTATELTCQQIISMTAEQTPSPDEDSVMQLKAPESTSKSPCYNIRNCFVCWRRLLIYFIFYIFCLNFMYFYSCLEDLFFTTHSYLSSFVSCSNTSATAGGSSAPADATIPPLVEEEEDNNSGAFAEVVESMLELYSFTLIYSSLHVSKF